MLIGLLPFSATIKRKYSGFREDEGIMPDSGPKSPIGPNSEDDANPEDTMIVPPPGFRERLIAAQRARTAQNKQSTGFQIPEPPPMPPKDSKDEPSKQS